MDFRKWEIKFDWAIYYSDINLEDILKTIPPEEIEKFKSYSIKMLERAFRWARKKSLEEEKEQLKMRLINRKLRLFVSEEDFKKLNREMETKNIHKYAKERIKNIEIGFHPKYRNLLTYFIDRRQRVGWVIIAPTTIEDCIKGNTLCYHGNNFGDYGENSFLIKTHIKILEKYFKILEKYEKKIVNKTLETSY